MNFHCLPTAEIWETTSLFRSFRINIFWNLVICNLCEVNWPYEEKIHGAEEKIEFKQLYLLQLLKLYYKALYTVLHLIFAKLINGRCI